VFVFAVIIKKGFTSVCYHEHHDPRPPPRGGEGRILLLRQEPQTTSINTPHGLRLWVSALSQFQKHNKNNNSSSLGDQRSRGRQEVESGGAAFPPFVSSGLVSSSPHSIPKPLAYVMAFSSRSLSLSLQEYSGSSSALKQV